MPDVAGIHINSQLLALSDSDQDCFLYEDGEVLFDEAIEGIRLTFDESNFLEFNFEEMGDMVNETAAIFREYCLDSFLNLQRELRSGTEIADLIDRYENEEPDWEV